MATTLLHGELTRSVIGAFSEVYKTLGYGFLETVYSRALEQELLARGHVVQRDVSVYVQYKGQQVATQRLDLIVDEKLVVEIKSTFELSKVAPRQLFNYLRATHLEVGLLLHFGPAPQFVRLISSNRHEANPPHPLHPPHPHTTWLDPE